MTVEHLHARNLMAADTAGVTHLDTAEFLLGSVTVTPVFFESNGQVDPETQDWSTAEIQETLDKVYAGTQWWSDALDTFDSVHSLDFVVDETYARNPVSTPYEQIDRASERHTDGVSDFLVDAGFADALSVQDGVRQFNDAQRTKHGTDWAFTIFVFDSSDDDDGFFPQGGRFRGAFAFAGGQYVVTPSARPASTYAHEIGHIFWANDEYAGGDSYSATRGYYNTPNSNAADNPAPGFIQQPSIMASGFLLQTAYVNHTSPASTFATVGWQDSDGDGIFDVLDVPLELNLSGHFDAQASVYRVTGDATAVPLENENSAGPQSDITLNRISRLEYRVDGGPWRIAASPDTPQAAFDLAVPVDDSFESIAFRVTDDATGVTSATVTGTAAVPILATQANVAGFAFLDQNGDGQRQAGEPLVTDVIATIRPAGDASPPLAGRADAADLDPGAADPTAGTFANLAADGFVIDPVIGVGPLNAADDRQVFRAFDLQRGRWQSFWSPSRQFVAQFDQPVGNVSIDAIGFTSRNYVRIEAYDDTGQWIGRVTSPEFAAGDARTLSIEDPRSRIAEVRVFGHAETRIAVAGIEVAAVPPVTTDEHGGWAFAHLPDGRYTVDLAPTSVFQRIESPTIDIQVVGGKSDTVAVGVTASESVFQNPGDRHDVNDDGAVTPFDALLVINDLARRSSRELTAQDAASFTVDVNGDGFVSPLDALLVVNRISLDNDPRAAGEPVVAAGAMFGDRRVGSVPDTTLAMDTTLAPAPNDVPPPTHPVSLSAPGLLKIAVPGREASERRSIAWGDIPGSVSPATGTIISADMLGGSGHSRDSQRERATDRVIGDLFDDEFLL